MDRESGTRTPLFFPRVALCIVYQITTPVETPPSNFYHSNFRNRKARQTGHNGLNVLETPKDPAGHIVFSSLFGLVLQRVETLT